MTKRPWSWTKLPELFIFARPGQKFGIPIILLSCEGTDVCSKQNLYTSVRIFEVMWSLLIWLITTSFGSKCGSLWE